MASAAFVASQEPSAVHEPVDLPNIFFDLDWPSRFLFWCNVEAHVQNIQIVVFSSTNYLKYLRLSSDEVDLRFGRHFTLFDNNSSLLLLFKEVDSFKDMLHLWFNTLLILYILFSF